MTLFLDAATQLTATQLSQGQAASLFALGATLLVVLLLLVIGAYIYLSFAYMAIARKNKQSSPGIAWIPGVGPLIIAYRGSKMHWWPWLLIIGFFIPIINLLAGIAFFVFEIIWNWKLLEAIKKPGWWAIFLIIQPVYWVFVGIAAWSKR